MVRSRVIVSVAIRTVLTLLVAAFAMPVIESLILRTTVEAIVPRWDVHLAIWGPVSLVIGVVAEYAYVKHVKRIAARKTTQTRPD